MTALPDAQPELLVGDRDFHTLARTDRNLILAGERGGVYVYWDARE